MRSFQRYVEEAGQPLVRDRLDILQVNIGYVCNLACRHCHLEAGPHRTEAMSREVVDDCLRFVRGAGPIDVDITGGAPEANEHLAYFIGELRRLPNVKRIIARSNLAILEEAGKSHLPEFFAANDVDIVSSMPCYLESNVAAQRGGGVYEKNVRVLKRLNSLGYGTGKHRLDLVYNPGGAFLPGPQGALEADYKENLGNDFGIRFDNLLTIANMPIGRFRTDLEQAGQLAGYLELLEDSFNAHNLGQVMCRSQISVDWQGRMYDCDFNQALGQTATEARIGAVSARELVGLPITCGDHCFACTAGAGSSCRGSLEK